MLELILFYYPLFFSFSIDSLLPFSLLGMTLAAKCVMVRRDPFGTPLYLGPCRPTLGLPPISKFSVTVVGLAPSDCILVGVNLDFPRLSLH